MHCFPTPLLDEKKKPSTLDFLDEIQDQAFLLPFLVFVSWCLVLWGIWLHHSSFFLFAVRFSSSTLPTRAQAAAVKGSSPLLCSSAQSLLGRLQLFQGFETTSFYSLRTLFSLYLKARDLPFATSCFHVGIINL